MVTVAGDEELGSERVTEGEPEKRQPGTLKTIMEHLLLIFAEGCFPDDIPQAAALFRATVEISRPASEDDLVPSGGLVPPGGQATVELAAVLVAARDVITAWMAKQTVISMVVSATSRQAAEGEGWKVARALGAGPRAEVSAEPWTHTRPVKARQQVRQWSGQ